MDESILKLTNIVIEHLIKEESYQSLLKTTILIAEDESLQKLIKTFKEAEIKYNAAKKYGQHHPDLKPIKAAFQASKIAIYHHPTIIQHKHHEKAFQSILNDIASKITDAVMPINYGGKVCLKENV